MLGDVGGHRTVEVDRQERRDRARRLEEVEFVEERLRAADGERRDDHDAAPGRGARDHAPERVERVDRVVHAIAVGRLEHQRVDVVTAFRRAHDAVVRAAEVAGEEHRTAASRDADAGGAEDVPGRRQPDLEALGRREGRAGLDRAQARERGVGVLLREQRERGLVLRVPHPVGERRVFLVQARASGSSSRRGRAWPACTRRDQRTPADQQRQVAAVVEVRVRQDDRGEARRRIRQRRPVAKAQLLEALEQAAVDEQRTRPGA